MFGILSHFQELAKMQTFDVKVLSMNVWLNNCFLCLIALITISCSNTPNNLSMNTSQGKCVQLSQYNSKSQNWMLNNTPTYYSLVQYNPPSSTITPYCMAITVQNNNSGYNANNTQVTNNGLQITYTPTGGTSTTSTLYDPAAAGITITGESQQASNIVLFDPANCVTSTGANVTNLAAGGGSCTFYLEILDEANPVGVYPYNLTYNYTNGNINYSIGININQRVYLYGGAQNGLYFVSTNAVNASSITTTVASWQTGINGAPTTNISFLIQDYYGFLYFASLGQAYMFNGSTTTTVGGSLPSSITSLAFDMSGNIYASTTNNGVWVYNKSSANPIWNQMIDSRGYITSSTRVLGLKGVEYPNSPNIMYTVTSNATYGCNNLNASLATESCTLATTNSPNTFFSNSYDVDSSGNFYAGSVFGGNLGVSPWNGLGVNWGTQYTVYPYALPYSGSPLPQVGSVSWQNSIVYFGLVNESYSESSAYICTGLACSPLISESGFGNSLTGNINNITNDGAGNIYLGGSSMYSLDWESSIGRVPSSFLLFGTSAAAGSSNWKPISPTLFTPSSINYMVVSSMLTSY